MKIKTTFAVIALTLSPSLALAWGGCNEAKMQSASQCEAGQSWDAATQSCVTATTS